jgi:type III secretory pathway component EscS
VWIARELWRVVSKILLAALIAILIAEVRALTSPGDRMRTFRFVLIAIGGLLVALAAMGGSNYERYVNVRTRWATRYLGLPEPRATTTDPRLTPAAVLVGSGVPLIVLGFLV